MKGIIVVDIPKNCEKCDISEKIYRGNELVIDCPHLDYLVDKLNNRDENCPIKPMPEKREPKEHPVSHRGIFMEGFETGWNDCIDKILKGENIEEKEKINQSEKHDP